MATQLQKNLSKVRRGPGGQLSLETDEELQSLAKKSGLQAPPLTPMGGAMLGANPDQQKMIGTSAQKQAAFNFVQQTGTPQDLQTSLRRQQARTTTTEEEQKAQQRAEQLQGLGATGQRAQSYIDAQIAKLTQSQAAPQVTPSQATVAQPEGISGVPTGSADQLKADLESYQKNPQDLQALARINKMLGRTADQPLTAEELEAYYQDPAEAIAQGTAKAISDTMTVGDLISQPEFGYTSEQLSSLLGIPATEIGNLTISQLQDKVDQLQQAEYSRSAQAQQVATSTAVGGAERAAARQLGRELSATGTRATENQVQQLAQSLDSAETVSFGGQQYQIGDLLKDDTISDIVTQYFDNPQEAEKLRSTEFASFLDRNREALKQAAEQRASGVSKLGEIQQANKALAQVGNQTLSPQLMDAFIPGWSSGEVRAEQIDPASIGGLKYLKSLSPSQANAAAESLNAVLQVDPSVAGELAGLTEEQWRQLDPGRENSKWKQYIADIEQWNELENVSPEDTEAVLTKFFGSPVDSDKLMQENRVRTALGLPHYDIGLIDQDHDGRVDTGRLLDTMRAGGKPTAAEAVKGMQGYTPHTPPQEPGLTGINESIYNKLSSYLDDGKLTPDEINRAGLTIDEMIELTRHPEVSTLPGAETIFQKVRQYQADQEREQSAGEREKQQIAREQQKAEQKQQVQDKIRNNYGTNVLEIFNRSLARDPNRPVTISTAGPMGISIPVTLHPKTGAVVPQPNPTPADVKRGKMTSGGLDWKYYPESQKWIATGLA